MDEYYYLEEYFKEHLNPQNSICCYDRYLPNYSKKIS